MTINEIQDEIIEEFAVFDDWMDKYNYLIEMGQELEPLPEKEHAPENLIDGCQSRVWITAREDDGRMIFNADSDAILVKGLIALLLKVVNGHTPQEIANADLYFIDRIGMRENLSPTRANGFASMIKRIKTYALAYGNKQNRS